jgi:hypothetical protein
MKLPAPENSVPGDLRRPGQRQQETARVAVVVAVAHLVVDFALVPPIEFASKGER